MILFFLGPLITEFDRLVAHNSTFMEMTGSATINIYENQMRDR